MVRTTVRLDEGLMRDAKRAAAEQGITLTQLISDALRERMARARRAAPRQPVELPISRAGGGVMPGVDLDDSAALLELLDGGALIDRER